MLAVHSLEKSALISASVFGALIVSGALLLPFFYFKTCADKLVDLIRDDQVTLAELSINVVAWISVPNEAYDL
jgi:hypothetical protein